jgi:hypothetical protein
MDGQIERVNGELNQYLKNYMGDKQCWTGIGFLTYPSSMGI